MLGDKYKEYKDKNGVTPLDAFKKDTVYVEEQVASERMDICKSCPELIKLTTQCKQCYCIMYLKTKFQEAKCPLGKW